MDQLASKVTQEDPNWAHLEPLVPTLEALLPAWGIPLRTLEALLATVGIPLPILRIFTVFSVNNCAFLLKIHETPQKFCRLHQKL